jgi:hypothetical protein
MAIRTLAVSNTVETCDVHTRVPRGHATPGFPFRFRSGDFRARGRGPGAANRPERALVRSHPRLFLLHRPFRPDIPFGGSALTRRDMILIAVP